MSIFNRWFAGVRPISARLAAVKPQMRYLVLMLASSVFALGSGLVFARLLGNEGYGSYALANLVAHYGAYLCTLGLSEGLLRQISLRAGQGDLDEVNRIRNIGLTGVMVLILITSSIYALVLIPGYAQDAQLRLTLLLVVPVVIGAVVLNIALVDLRARQLLQPFALMLMARNALLIVFGSIAAVLGFGFAGVLLVQGVTSAMLFLLVLRLWMPQFRLVLGHFSQVVAMAKLGLPFMLSQLLRNLAQSLDRWFVSALFGVAVFGQYAFALILFNVGLVFSNIIGQYFGPRLIFHFGRGDSAQQLHARITKLTLISGLVFLGAAIPVICGFVFLVRRFFPDYLLALELVPWIYFGVMANTMNLYDWLAMALGKGSLLIRMYIVNTLLIAAMCVFAWLQKAPVQVYAAIFCAGRFFNLAGSYAVVRVLLNQQAAERAVSYYDEK